MPDSSQLENVQPAGGADHSKPISESVPLVCGVGHNIQQRCVPLAGGADHTSQLESVPAAGGAGPYTTHILQLIRVPDVSLPRETEVPRLAESGTDWIHHIFVGFLGGWSRNDTAATKRKR